MFRKSTPQTSLQEVQYYLSPKMQARLDRTWASIFRARALPLLDETAFADFYAAEMGRPNVPVRLVLGVLLLKDWWDLTDQQALDALAFDVRWQTALGVDMDEAYLCQKTLHNFRAHLLEHAQAQCVFQSLTAGLIPALGIRTTHQRLDSTHILSRIAQLSRLHLFCATLRGMLATLTQDAPALRGQVPQAVWGRYLTEADEATQYEDAPARDTPRRLAVAARDAWRVWDALRGTPLPPRCAARYALLQRLLDEQCVLTELPAVPDPAEADVHEPPVPVTLKPAKAVGAHTLQTPHDPDVTYGHKGQGYEVQIAETYGNGDLPEMITHLAVTPSCGSDQTHTVPALEALAARGLQPDVLLADTGYGSTDNVLACAAEGTTVLSPVAGRAQPVPPDDVPGGGNFHVQQLPGDAPSCCPAGQPAVQDLRTPDPTGAPSGVTHVTLVLAPAVCAACPTRAQCPAAQAEVGPPIYTTTEEDVLLTRRRRAEATTVFTEAYAQRAGCEATNSEMKRGHGLGHLRVVTCPRVELAACLKGAACNLKRAVTYWTRQARTALREAGTSRTPGAVAGTVA